MDLTRLSNDKKLQLCQWYFKVGCVCLPFVWLVNATWFFKEAFMKPPYDEQPKIKKYVILSAIGAVIWAIIFIVWITMFQLKRVSWGATGDALSFVIPLGRP